MQTLTLKAGDILYLTTDGYADQNNVARKRLGSKEFVRILNKAANLDIKKQELILLDSLKQWMGEAEQRDDITVIALKLK